MRRMGAKREFDSMTTIRVLLAGCGNMGYAMLSGWISSGKLDAKETLVVEPNAELRERAARLGSKAVASADDIAAATCGLAKVTIMPLPMAAGVFGMQRITEVSLPRISSKVLTGVPAATLRNVALLVKRR